MKRRTQRWLWFGIPFAAVLLLLFLTYCTGGSGVGAPAKAIPNSPFAALGSRERIVRYLSLDSARPIPHVAIPQHPFMAANVGNNMHNDAYMSDTSEAAGPLGVNAGVRSRSEGFGGYGTIAFDRAGRLVGVYSNGRGFRLDLLDPETLTQLASLDLPGRSWYFPLQGIMPWEYIGAGMYFYLDQQDRAIVPTTLNTIQVIQVSPPGDSGGLKLVREYDLQTKVVPVAWPRTDSIAWVLPDWGGQYYWYATTEGMVGTVSVDSGAVQTRRLDGEIIENSFAVGEEGIFLISDRALYRLSQDGSGRINVDWRVEYDRGPAKKSGVITRGSGTSVTLVGGQDGFVVVTDNAESQVHLLFVRRADGSVACRTPLFQAGQSAADITAIAFQQADAAGQSIGRYSALIENNWGHQNFPLAAPAPGITRVDLIREENGSLRCEEIWTSGEKNLGVYKFSLGSGLLYLYFKDDALFDTRWYLTAVDFNTGRTVYRQLVGDGIGYNNWAGALFIAPHAGAIYSTTIFGLVMISDGPPARTGVTP